MSKMNIKTGDNVMVISGTERGKKGKVLAVSPSEGKVIIEKDQDGIQACKAPQGRREGRHSKGRIRALRLQGYAHLPQVRRGDTRGSRA